MNIENILVPTDFSRCAQNAFSFAAIIAKKFDARIFLMHTESSTYSYTSLDRLTKQIDNEDITDLDIRTVIEMGDPGSSIIKQIDDTSADLVIMGSKGRSGARVLFGSTSLKVISDSPIPVMTIPENSTFEDFKQIVFATDYHTGDLSTLKEIIKWAQKFNSKLHVLHVSQKEENNPNISFHGFKAMVNEQINYEKLIFDHIIDKSFLKGFLDYLNKYKISLVVLTRYKKSFIQKIVGKDHTKQIEFYSNIPLLVLNSDK